jgi:hypothetical protein
VSSAFGVGFWLGPLPHQRAAGGPVSGVHGERCRPNTLRAVAVDLKAIFIGNREGPDEATGFSHRVGRYRFIRSRSGQARATMSRSPGRACLAGPVRAGQPGPGQLYQGTASGLRTNRRNIGAPSRLVVPGKRRLA